MSNVKILLNNEPKKHKALRGEKEKLSNLLGKTLRVDDFDITESEFNKDKECIHLQVTYLNDDGELVTSYVATESYQVIDVVRKNFSREKNCIIKVLKKKDKSYYYTIQPMKQEITRLLNAVENKGPGE